MAELGGAILARPTAGSAATGDWTATGLVLVLGTLVGAAWNWRPALWLDEVASLSAASRPLPDLARMLGQIDLVHAAYYLVLHGWIELFGSSGFSLRMPSAMAVGVTAAALHRAVRPGLGNRTALVVALVALTVPRMAWAGSEAREQGIAMALAMLATWCLLSARSDGRRWWWVGYWFTCVLGTLVSLFVVFLPVAHLVWAFLERRRTPWRPTGLVTILAGATMAPWALLASGQSGQVSWIGERSLVGTLTQIAVKQYFYGDGKPAGLRPSAPVLLAVVVVGLGFGLLALAAVVGCRRAVRRGRPSTIAFPQVRPDERSLVLLALCTLLVPLVLVLVAGLVTQPLYVPRYLTWTTPWLAILAVVGSRVRVGGRAVGRLLLALVVLVGLGLQAPLRQVVERPEDDYRLAAERVASATGEGAQLVFTEPWLTGVQLAYPDRFTRASGTNTTLDASSSARLYPMLAGPSSLASGPAGRVVVLAPGLDYPGQPADDWYRTLSERGCHRTSSTTHHVETISTWECP